MLKLYFKFQIHLVTTFGAGQHCSQLFIGDVIASFSSLISCLFKFAVNLQNTLFIPKNC